MEGRTVAAAFAEFPKKRLPHVSIRNIGNGGKAHAAYAFMSMILTLKRYRPG